MRNRFENYISNPYQSQFVSTPIDSNFAFNVINARQGYYDNIMKGIDSLNPDLEYIAPNQFDEGDLPIANQLREQRAQEQQKLIDDILKTDNLNDAARRVSKLANDQTYNQTKDALKMRKLQYEQERKMLDDSWGKDVSYNNYVEHFERNRMTPFDVTNYGLNSAVGANTPDGTKLVKEWTSMLEYDEIPLASGAFLGRTGDGQYYVSQGGSKTQVSQDKAFETLFTGIMGDPSVQNWLGVMDRIGKGKEAEAMIRNQISAGVRGSTFSRTKIDYGYHQSPYDIEVMKKGLENQEFDPNAQTSSVFTPTQFKNFDTIKVDDNGNVIYNESEKLQKLNDEYGMGNFTEKEYNAKKQIIREQGKNSFFKDDVIAQSLAKQYNLDPNKKEDVKKLVSLYNKTVEANKSREEYYNPIPAEKQQKIEAQNYGNNKIYYNLKTGEVQTFEDLNFDWGSAVKIGNGKPSKEGAIKGDVIQDKKGNMFAVTNDTDQGMVHYGGWNVIRSGMHDPNRTMDRIIIPTMDGREQQATVYYYYDDAGKKRALTVPEEYRIAILEKAQDTKTTKEFYDVLKEYAYPESEVENLYDKSYKLKYNQK